MVNEYKKRPVVISAIQFTKDTLTKCIEFCEGNGEDWYEWNDTVVSNMSIRIKTLEGIMTCNIGDYIIKGVNGEFYPCKPDIFEKTYDIVPYSTKNMTFDEVSKFFGEWLEFARLSWGNTLALHHNNVKPYTTLHLRDFNTDTIAKYEYVFTEDDLKANDWYIMPVQIILK